MGDHDVTEHHFSFDQESSTSIFTSLVGIETSPKSLHIFSSKDEETGSQRTLTGMITTVQAPSGFGACRSQRCSDVPISYPADEIESLPTKVQLVYRLMTKNSRTSSAASIKSNLPALSEASESTSRLRCIIYPESAISPRVFSDQETVMFEDGFDNTSGLDAKKEFLLKFTSALEIAFDSKTMTLTSFKSLKILIIIDSLFEDISVFKRGFVFLEYLTRSPKSMSCSEFEQNIMNVII